MPDSKDIYKQDRFYMNLEQDCVIWMYHNPDAVSGDQFVSNIFDKELLEEALEKHPPTPETDFGPSDAFDYIATMCRQYCTDIGDYAYDVAKEKFESEPDAVGCDNTTVETLTLLFKARELIEEFCEKEYGGPACFTDPKRIGLGYTTTEDDRHEVEVLANLADFRTEVYWDGELIATRKSESLGEYVENQLKYLDFNELIDIPGWVIEEFTQTGIHNPDLKYMQLEAWNTVYDTCIEVSTYMFGGGLYMSLHDLCEDGLEPYADITVNLEGYPTEPDCAFVDTNNFAQAEKLIADYKLGKPTGRVGHSGYCTYPEYRFDMNEIRKYCVNPRDIKIPENSKNERGDER